MTPASAKKKNPQRKREVTSAANRTTPSAPAGNDPLLGVHCSTKGGLPTAFERATKLGINTLQLFVKNNKQWFAPAIESELVTEFRSARAAWGGRGPVLAHGCYLLNLGSSKADIQEKTLRSYVEELTRANALGVDHFVFHPGSHLGIGEEEGTRLTAEVLNSAHELTEGFTTLSVIEITAGQGSSLGCSFEQLARIIDGVRDKRRVAVCLDTCHLFAAGYDLRNAEAWDETFGRFEAVVGFDRLVAIHTNDSKKGLGSRVDRHEHIGKGEIGIEGFRLLMNDSRFANIPKILETPKDDDMTEDYENLAVLRGLIA